jgi:P27 family predicted phage terminase small subunit
MRGRKKTPTVLKLVSGTQRKHRANPNEPDPEGDLYAPPESLTAEQKAEWVHALENAPLGLLRKLDRRLFTEWVIASTDLDEAESYLRKEGKVIKKGGDVRITINANGTQTKTVRSTTMVKNPWAALRRDAYDRMMRATCELGFSPTSRSRITLPGSKKETNRFSNNVARKNTNK